MPRKHKQHSATLNLIKLKKALSPFKKIVFVVVYGSFAQGKAGLKSDLDLAVSAEKKLSIDELIKINLVVSKHIGCEVDVVDLQQAEGVLLKEILTKGKIIFNRKPVIYCNLLKKMWYHQADFMPQYQAVLAKRRSRFIAGRKS